MCQGCKLASFVENLHPQYVVVDMLIYFAQATKLSVATIARNPTSSSTDIHIITTFCFACFSCGCTPSEDQPVVLERQRSQPASRAANKMTQYACITQICFTCDIIVSMTLVSPQNASKQLLFLRGDGYLALWSTETSSNVWGGGRALLTVWCLSYPLSKQFDEDIPTPQRREWCDVTPQAEADLG